MPFSESKKALVYHEAGHTIFGLFKGGGVEYVSVEGFPFKGGHTHSSDLPRPEDDAADYLAGGVAAEMFGLHSPASDGDVRGFERAAAKCGISWAQAEAEVRRVLSVSANRQALERVAEELQAYKRLNGERIVQIARDCGMRVESGQPQTGRLPGYHYLDPQVSQAYGRYQQQQSVSRPAPRGGRGDFVAEEPENHAQKTLCCFVLDESGSMAGRKVDALNAGFKSFCDQIRNDRTLRDQLEVAVVVFGDTYKVRVAAQPSLIANLTIPTIQGDGATDLLPGMRLAMDLVRSRKAWYRSTGQPYLRPWLVLMTDGEPNGTQEEFRRLASEIHTAIDNKEFQLMALGVEGADMDFLRLISHPSMPPCALEGVKFIDFFSWLSRSMSIVAQSRPGQKINFPNPSNWMAGVNI